MRGADIERVRPPIRPSGLRKVHVAVDQPWCDPHPADVGDVDAFGDGTLRCCAGAIDLPLAQDHVCFGHRRAAAAVDQRRASEGVGRGGRAGGRVDGAGDGDLPAVRRVDEQSLRNADVLLAAGVAHAIAIGAIHPSRLQRSEVDVAGLDRFRPRSARFREVVVAGRESGRTAAHEQRRMEVVREVGIEISLADGVDVRLENGASAGDVVALRQSAARKKSRQENRPDSLHRHIVECRSIPPSHR